MSIVISEASFNDKWLEKDFLSLKVDFFHIAFVEGSPKAKTNTIS